MIGPLVDAYNVVMAVVLAGLVGLLILGGISLVVGVAIASWLDR